MALLDYLKQKKGNDYIWHFICLVLYLRRIFHFYAPRQLEMGCFRSLDSALCNLSELILNCIIYFKENLHTHTHTPVSYTHLDVYKRQFLCFYNMCTRE